MWTGGEWEVPRGRPSRADFDLAAEVRELGVLISARQVQKVREEYRIIRSDRRFPGGGGSESSYEAGTADRVAAFQKILRLIRSLPLAKVLFYLDGHSLGVDALEDALDLGLPDGKLEGDPWKAQDREAQKIRKDKSDSAKAFRRITKSHDVDPSEAMSEIVALWHGETFTALSEGLSEGEVPHLVKAVGLEEAWLADPDAAARVDEALTPFPLAKSSQAWRGATLTQLSLARERTVNDMEVSIIDALQDAPPRSRKLFAVLVAGGFLAKLVGVKREEGDGEGKPIAK